MEYVIDTSDERPTVTAFLTEEGIRVEWSDPGYLGGPEGSYTFLVSRDGGVLGRGAISTASDEGALQELARLTASQKRPEELRGTVS